MKKLIAIALFALPFTTLKAQDLAVSTGEIKIGRIENIHSDGSADLVDNKTGKTVRITGTSLEASLVRINGTSLEASFTLEIGTPFGYIEIQTAEGVKPVIVVSGTIIDDINGLIR